MAGESTFHKYHLSLDYSRFLDPYTGTLQQVQVLLEASFGAPASLIERLHH